MVLLKKIKYQSEQSCYLRWSSRCHGNVHYIFWKPIKFSTNYQNDVSQMSVIRKIRLIIKSVLLVSLPWKRAIYILIACQKYYILSKNFDPISYLIAEKPISVVVGTKNKISFFYAFSPKMAHRIWTIFSDSLSYFRSLISMFVSLPWKRTIYILIACQKYYILSKNWTKISFLRTDIVPRSSLPNVFS